MGRLTAVHDQCHEDWKVLKAAPAGTEYFHKDAVSSWPDNK